MIDLQKKADEIRADVIRVAVKNNKGHIAPSLSTVEILTALYYEIMGEEDRFILSKGHGCYALYAILVDKGLIPKKVWENFELTGCVTRQPEYGLLASTGSLGQGLSMACGIAYAKKLTKAVGNVYCLLGDGELEEGQVWEALLFAEEKKLDNLYILVDSNKLRAMDKNKLCNQAIRSRLNGFNFEVMSCDGHDIDDILFTLNYLLKDKHRGFPKFIICNTVKGKGLKCAENVAKFHYRVPSQEELNES